MCVYIQYKCVCVWSVREGIFQVLQKFKVLSTILPHMFTVCATMFAPLYLCVNVRKCMHVVMLRAVAFTTGCVYSNLCVL